MNRPAQLELVGRKIRQLRRQRKLTQVELAEKIGIHQSDLSRMEQGEYKVGLDTLLKILGTFARQPIERGRLHYLDFIPSTLASVRRCLDELPDHAELARLFPMDFSLPQARERLKGTTADGPTQDHAPAR